MLLLLVLLLLLLIILMVLLLMTNSNSILVVGEDEHTSRTIKQKLERVSLTVASKTLQIQDAQLQAVHAAAEDVLAESQASGLGRSCQDFPSP